MSKILAIQHTPCEGLGIIADCPEAEGLSAEVVQVYKGEPVPRTVGEATGLIILGGPMGVYEEKRYPFLRQELHLIDQALKEQKPVLGICLGSQLLATALGARVRRGKQREIGWHPVTLTEPASHDQLWKGIKPSFVAYHWHGDIFDLPRSATLLAWSALTACQGFRYRCSAYGFLFHLEVTEKIIQDMVTMFAEQLEEEMIEVKEIVAKAATYLPHLKKVGETVFGRWASV